MLGKTGHTRLFLILSLLILLADALFVALNHVSDRQALQARLQSEGEQLRKAFHVALSMTLNNMSQLATFVAASPEVQRLFTEAGQAVADEGGGPGGERAAQLRRQLYATVSPGWDRMTREYQVRQLHFHLGPGSTSFLRVHKPERFGDNMDRLRHMIVDVNRDQLPRQGLELGRVYAGLRGVVPVYSSPRRDEAVGALEVGTSFSTLIGSLSAAVGQQVAVLLREDRVERATWNRPDEPLTTDCGCFIEATSSADLDRVLAARQRQGWAAGSFDTRTGLLDTAAGPVAVTEFGIADYIGLRDGHAEPVGRVMIWRAADQDLLALHRATWINVLYALVGFVIIELVLYLSIRLTLRRLEQQVEQRTREMRVLNARLEAIAHQDYLTGVYSRRHFMERLQQEINRSRREQTPLSLLMLDIDHFKSINDQWGHQTGDDVLAALGELLRSRCRDYDVVGRYGGEEFCLLLPGANGEQAWRIAEALRQQIRDRIRLAEAPDVEVTASFGIAELRPEQTLENWFREADQALYRAKREGRNRSVLHQVAAPAQASASTS